MFIKGLLRICKGVFSSNVLTFEDIEVTPSVSLRRLTQDHHSGYGFIPTDESVIVEANKQSVSIGDLTVDGEITINGELFAGEYD